MARKRKNKKLPKIKRISLFKSDLLSWSNERLWFFFISHPAIYRSFARQQRVDLSTAYSTVGYVLNNYDRDILCSDIRIVYEGYKKEVPHDVNWNKKFYRELVVLINMYLKELKTGEELYSPPANMSIDLSDRWVFQTYKYHDLEEDIVKNFNLRYLLHLIFKGLCPKELDLDSIDLEHPIQSLLAMRLKLPFA